MKIIDRKALLIVPPTGLYNREERNQALVSKLAVPALRPPLDLCYIAAVLQKRGVECRIADFPAERLVWEDLETLIRDFRPDALIISSTTFTLSLDLKSCSLTKRIDPHITTITKGAQVSVQDQETLKRYPDLDIIVRREYEETFSVLANNNIDLKDIAGITYRKNGGIFRNPDRNFISDLDIIPFPSRELINNGNYIRADTAEKMTTIQVSRGCPNGCIFCLAEFLYGNMQRKRSPGNILEEIQGCKKKFGLHNFFFRADTFTLDKDWVIDLCRQIVEMNLDIDWVCNSRVNTLDTEILMWMKKAGCWGVALGIESGSQRSLDEMSKHITIDQSRKAVKLCHDLGIKSLLYFVIGFPWENEQDIYDSIRFAKELKGDFVEFNIVVPFPGTQYYELARREDLLTSETFEGYGYWRPMIRTKYLSSEKLLRLRKKAMVSSYLDPCYIIRTFVNLKSLPTFLRYLKFGLFKLFKVAYS
jgi:anaerobic magnesium-protoporphyrin IX monomethyl ester cyclase